MLLILSDAVGDDKVSNVLKDKPEMIKLYTEIFDNSQLIRSNVDSLSHIGDGSRLTERSHVKEENGSGVGGNRSLEREKVERAGGKNKSQMLNQSNLANNQSNQHEDSKRLQNPWTNNNNINNNKSTKSIK